MMISIIKYIKNKCPKKEKITPEVKAEDIFCNQVTSIANNEQMKRYENTEVSANQDIQTILQNNFASVQSDISRQRLFSNSTVLLPQ